MPEPTDATLTRQRRVCFVLRRGSQADGVIADWIDALQDAGMEHSTAIRNILRACIEGQPFLTPFKYLHYAPQTVESPPQTTPKPSDPEYTEAQTGISDADLALLKQLREQMRGNP